MRYFTLICLYFLCVSTGLTNPLDATSLGFDIKKANQQFDRINIQLSVQNLNLSNLNTALDTLSTMTAKADQCVGDVQKKLTSIEMLIKQNGGAKEKANEGADLIYLNSQQKELADEQAQCRLFSIRAKEAIEAYKTAIATLKQKETLTRGIPLWKIIHQISDSPLESSLINVFTTKIPNVLPSLFSWIVILCTALISATLILLKLHKSQFARHHLRLKKIHFRYIFLLASAFISGAILTYLLIASQDFTTSDLPLILSGLVFFYLSSIVFTLFVFKLKNIRAFFYWYSLDNHFFQSFTVTTLSFNIAAMTGHIFASSFNINSSLWLLSQNLFLLAVLFTGGYYTYNFCQIHRQFAFVKNHRRLIQRLSISLLISCATIDILGYQTLAEHLTFSGFATFTCIFITILIIQGINQLYLMLNQQQATKSKIIKYFGYGEEQVFTEFLILKTVAQLIVIAICFYLIGQSLGFATDYIESIYNHVLYGIHLANVTLYPTRIISGVVVFCLLYLVFRAISTSISRHQQFEDEEETQVAVASILTYIGFSLAIISGFLVAGFNFTGLAIIAGALSVGIGLGLQSIVNNFVSGLILLIEKPIRPGDRISVDGIEGFVKKIRVRSTQIISPGSEDIIIPNSDLITRPVTNYMFSDIYCRISCEVGVAYGSNTLLVRDVLLNVAGNHEEIIKTGRNKPIVLFLSFADNSLEFELVCLIKDVNKKAIVRSDLHYAIEQAFREHNIDMPFPQRELHLKLDDLGDVKKNLDELEAILT